LESLEKWLEVFSNTKGKAAQNMKAKILPEIARIKRMQREKRQAYR
jgi:hypothetical protein